MTMDLNKEAGIDTTWLSVANYKFKILVMISCLAQNHLAFRGKLKDMCDFLGVGNTTSNTKKIKEVFADWKQYTSTSISHTVKVNEKKSKKK